MLRTAALSVMHKRYKQIILGFLVSFVVCGCAYKTEEIDNFESQLGCNMGKEEVISIVKMHEGTVLEEKFGGKSAVRAEFNNKQEFLIFFHKNGKLSAVNKREVYQLIFWYKEGGYAVTNECNA